MQNRPPEWQLPPGITPDLWAFLTDSDQAHRYDSLLASTPLLEQDQRFVERHCPTVGRLVDLGCGTGRLSVLLAKRGDWVVAVDLSEEMLRIVGCKAKEARLTVHRVQANIVELGVLADASFDYAACLFSTLGMVAGSINRVRAVEHVLRLLRPGGVFVVHVHNRWFNFWDRAGRRWLLKDCLPSLLRQAKAGDRPVPRADGRPGWSLHHFTRREIVGLLQNCGFEIVAVQPVSLRTDGRLVLPSWFGWLRSYGYLIAARRPR